MKNLVKEGKLHVIKSLIHIQVSTSLIKPVKIFHHASITVLIVHRIVLFWEPDRCFQDGGQENRREVGTYFITISSVY